MRSMAYINEVSAYVPQNIHFILYILYYTYYYWLYGITIICEEKIAEKKTCDETE